MGYYSQLLLAAGSCLVSSRFGLSSTIWNCNRRCPAHQARWASFVVHGSTVMLVG